MQPNKFNKSELMKIIINRTWNYKQTFPLNQVVFAPSVASEGSVLIWNLDGKRNLSRSVQQFWLSAQTEFLPQFLILLAAF